MGTLGDGLNGSRNLGEMENGDNSTKDIYPFSTGDLWASVDIPNCNKATSMVDRRSSLVLIEM